MLSAFFWTYAGLFVLRLLLGINESGRGLILDGFGWRAVFVSLGLASLGWLALVAPRMLATASIPAPVPGPSPADILKKREAWGAFLGSFLLAYGAPLLDAHDALTGWLRFCATAAGEVLGGGFSDAWIRRGASTNLARKAFCVTGLCGSAVLLLPSVIERLGNLAGIVAGVVTGFIVERTGRFYFAIVWVCVLLPVGACSYLLIIPKVTPVP